MLFHLFPSSTVCYIAFCACERSAKLQKPKVAHSRALWAHWEGRLKDTGALGAFKTEGETRCTV